MNKGLIFVALLMVFALFCSGCAQDTAAPVDDLVGELQEEEYEEAHGDDGHDHGDLLFEWGGVFTFAAGTYALEFQESGDPSIGLVFLLDEGDRDYSDHLAYHIFEHELEIIPAGGSFEVVPEFGYQLTLNLDATSIFFVITEPGDYLVYMEHLPEEFGLIITAENGSEIEPRDVIEYEGIDQEH